MRLFYVIYLLVLNCVTRVTTQTTCIVTEHCKCSYNVKKESLHFICRNNISDIKLIANKKQSTIYLSCGKNADNSLYFLLPNLNERYFGGKLSIRIQRLCVVPDHFTTVTDLLPPAHKVYLERLNISYLNHNFFNKPSIINDLNLSNNKLKALNDSTFSNLTLLQRIDLSWNRFQTLPAKLFSENLCLVHFFLNHNQKKLIKFEDKILSNLKFLETVSLVNISTQLFPEKMFENSSGLYEIALNENSMTQLNG